MTRRHSDQTALDGSAGSSATRSAAYLFACAGLITLLNVFLVGLPPGASPSVLIGTSAAAFAAAAFSHLAPWDRWPGRATLGLVPVALVLVSIGNMYGGEDPYTPALYFVVLFVWIGIALPRWTSALVSPLAALAYLVPYLLDPAAPAAAVPSAFIAIPVCVLVGETIASAFDKATRARILDARRAASLEALVAAGTTLQNETDGHRVGDLAVNLAVSVLDAVGAAVVLTDVDGAPVSVFSRLFDTTEATAIAATTPPVADGEPQWLDATLVVPLPGTVAPVGALIVAVKAEAVGDPFVAHAAQLFAAKAGAAIEQLRVLDALADAAVRDGLTGIGNRRHAGHLLDSLRPGDAVVVIDLDHFKLVNDEWGHGAGDRILIAVGQFLKGAVRDGDDVARLGGEEFLLVMRQPRDAAAAAERLVHQWRETRPVATCSAGVEMHSADRSPEETMHRADTALYWAKNSGRDRSVAAEDLPVEAFAGPISSFTEAPIAGLPR